MSDNVAVLKLDLQHFFPTITAGRVLAIFLAAGYPEPVARLMAGLGTNTLPSGEWRQSAEFLRTHRDWLARRLYRQPHLPQGAPTSPALANLGAYRLDLRLAGLARSIGASFTRYADDLVFSGDQDFERKLDRLPAHVMAIAMEEGFAINPRKTRIMRQGVRQLVAGVVINNRTNVTRKDYDLLKATLHNCLHRGPEGQNRGNKGDFRRICSGGSPTSARSTPNEVGDFKKLSIASTGRPEVKSQNIFHTIIFSIYLNAMDVRSDPAWSAA